MNETETAVTGSGTVASEYKREKGRDWIHFYARRGSMRSYIQIGSISTDEPSAKIKAHEAYCREWFTKSKYGI